MQEKHNNGFLLGLLIGGAVGALVSTKRGRQILKDIVEYGFDYVGKTIDMDDIEDILNGEGEEEFFDDELDMTKTKATVEKEKKPMEKEEPRRRLFRGIRKK